METESLLSEGWAAAAEHVWAAGRSAVLSLRSGPVADGWSAAAAVDAMVQAGLVSTVLGLLEVVAELQLWQVQEHSQEDAAEVVLGSRLVGIG